MNVVGALLLCMITCLVFVKACLRQKIGFRLEAVILPQCCGWLCSKYNKSKKATEIGSQIGNDYFHYNLPTLTHHYLCFLPFIQGGIVAYGHWARYP